MLSVLSSSTFSSFARKRGSPSGIGPGLPIETQTLTLPTPPTSRYLHPSIFQHRTFSPTPIPTLQTEGPVSASVSLASTSFMSGPGPNGIDPGLLEPSDITIAIRKMLGPSEFQRSASLQVDSTVAGPSTSGRSSTAARDVEVVDGSGLLELPAPSCGETRNALSKCCSVSAPASSPLPENELEPASRKRSESITRERRSSDTHTVSSIATANVESQAEPDFSAAAADDLDAPPSQVAPSTSDLPACEPEQSTTVSAVADVTPADVEGESQQGEHGAMALTEEVEAAAPVPAVGIVSGSRYIETGLLDCSSPPTSASGCTAASDFDGGSIFRSEPDVQASTRFHELKAFSILSFLPRRSKGTLPFSDAALASRTSEGPTNAGIKSLFGKMATPIAKRPKAQSGRSGGHSQLALPSLVSFKSLSLVFA